jgi:GMP synthase (glutamine-hydrolysing)
LVVAARAQQASHIPHSTDIAAATFGSHRPVSIHPSLQERLAMPLQILVIQHCPLTPVGLVGAALEGAGAELTTVMPHHGDPFPEDPDRFDGLVLCGGPMHAGDDENYPAFPPMLRLIRRFHGSGRPVLGLCLGAQLIARAFGREIVKWRELELGFIPLKLTSEGRGDRLLRGTAPRPRLMQFHEDTFALPDGAKLLLTGDCPNQGFRIGDTTYGFQFHMEVTLPDAYAWLRDCRDWIQRHYGAEAEQRIGEVTDEIGGHHAPAAAWTAMVTERWMELVTERKLWRQDLLPLRASA